jgi:hypothetical protein
MKSYLDANVVNKQITKPCEDCPFRRVALAGWLAEQRPADYCQMAHSDDLIQCHTKKLADGNYVQCAGAAIYRANVAKRCDPPNLKLPEDGGAVFVSPVEFVEHHSRKKITPGNFRKLMLEAFRRRMESIE